MGLQSGMKLGLIMNGLGYGWADWRHPAMPIDACTSFDFHARQARVSEQGKFDYLFIADGVYADARSMPKVLSHLEPVALLAALASITSRIGLVGTLSVTYSEPYNLARQLASLDRISGGRAGWNVVTTGSPEAAANFGKESHLAHDDRYRLAEEFIEVVRGLWDSFEEGAIIGDKDRGVFLDASKLHTLDHRGEFFSVRGPLNIDRSPQGQPVIFQAGVSDAGRDFAARYADAIFVMPKGMDDSTALSQDMKARVAAKGRDPERLFVLPGITTMVAATSGEAQRLALDRAALGPIESRVMMLGNVFSGYDFSPHDLDAPFPLDIPEKWLNGYRGNVLAVQEAARRDHLTLRQAAERFGAAPNYFQGTPDQVADEMQRWFEGGAADGFMLNEPFPGQLELFVEQVVPILQKRGLFRKDYDGETLRDHFGLEVPANRFVQPAA